MEEGITTEFWINTIIPVVFFLVYLIYISVRSDQFNSLVNKIHKLHKVRKRFAGVDGRIAAIVPKVKAIRKKTFRWMPIIPLVHIGSHFIWFQAEYIWSFLGIALLQFAAALSILSILFYLVKGRRVLYDNLPDAVAEGPLL